MPIQPTDDPKIKSMKGIHLYHFSQSNCSMRIRLQLEEKGLSWTSHYIDLMKGENLAEYEKLQPNQELIDFHKMTLADGHIPQAKIDEAEAELRRLFSRIDKNLEKYDWIAGDTMSLADIAWIPNYTLLDYNKFPFEDFPRVMKWIDKLVNRPSYEAAVTRWFDYVPVQDQG